MVRIKQAAELTGVPESTLRAWERRYGAFRTHRSASGYRLYDEDAIARIRQMQALVASGLPPRAASAEVALRRGDSRPGGLPASAADPDELERLIAALAELDAGTVQRIVDGPLALRDFETWADGWLMPVLQRVGRAWADQEISVAGEHLMSHVVMRRLAAAYDAAGAPGSKPPVIVGTPSGVLHDLGLMAFAVCLRRQGAATLYLGNDVPPDAWADALTSTRAVASVTAVYRRADGPRVAALAERLWLDQPSAPIAVGGSHQRLAPKGCVQLGHSIANGALEVVAMLLPV